MYEVLYFNNGVNQTVRSLNKLEALSIAVKSCGNKTPPIRIVKVDATGNSKGAIWDIRDYADNNLGYDDLNDIYEKEKNQEKSVK